MGQIKDGWKQGTINELVDLIEDEIKCIVKRLSALEVHKEEKNDMPRDRNGHELQFGDVIKDNRYGICGIFHHQLKDLIFAHWVEKGNIEFKRTAIPRHQILFVFRPQKPEEDC